MPNEQKGVPWPIWAVVTIIAALIAGGYLTFKPSGTTVKPEPTPPISQPGSATTPPHKVTDPISGTYLMDNQKGRIIVVTHLDGNRYRIEEATSPWPWAGEATLDGGQLIGNGQFRKSLASMKVEGTLRGDKSIVVSYKFITKGDGKDAAGRVDNHVWYPQK